MLDPSVSEHVAEKSAAVPDMHVAQQNNIVFLPAPTNIATVKGWTAIATPDYALNHPARREVAPMIWFAMKQVVSVYQTSMVDQDQDQDLYVTTSQSEIVLGRPHIVVS